MPIPNNYQDSILTKWLAKPVLASKLLDDAESLETWSVENVGQAKGQMTLTAERKMSGASALRLRCAMVGDAPTAGRYYGTTSARRVVAGEDWSAWNRLSFWAYADLPGVRVVSLIVTFHNAGKEPVPDSYGKMGVNYVILKNHEWNHIVWEIANLPRDKVTGLDFSYRMQGHEPGAADMATFDFDKLELQKVDADHYEGWDVAPGAISFSHSGYQTGSPKSAIASDLPRGAIRTGRCADRARRALEKGDRGEFADRPLPGDGLLGGTRPGHLFCARRRTQHALLPNRR